MPSSDGATASRPWPAHAVAVPNVLLGMAVAAAVKLPAGEGPTEHQWLAVCRETKVAGYPITWRVLHVINVGGTYLVSATYHYSVDRYVAAVRLMIEQVEQRVVL